MSVLRPAQLRQMQVRFLLQPGRQGIAGTPGVLWQKQARRCRVLGSSDSPAREVQGTTGRHFSVPNPKTQDSGDDLPVFPPQAGLPPVPEIEAKRASFAKGIPSPIDQAAARSLATKCLRPNRDVRLPLGQSRRKTRGWLLRRHQDIAPLEVSMREPVLVKAADVASQQPRNAKKPLPIVEQIGTRTHQGLQDPRTGELLR